MGKSADRKMDELKRGKRCMDCLIEGIQTEWPSECLQFDHRDPDEKVSSIRQLIWHPEELAAELLKCDIVCANHHAIRTRKRGVSEKTKAAIRAARNKPGDRERDSKLQKQQWKANHHHRARAVAEAQRRPEVRQKNSEAQREAWKRRKQNKSSSSEKT